MLCCFDCRKSFSEPTNVKRRVCLKCDTSNFSIHSISFQSAFFYCVFVSKWFLSKTNSIISGHSEMGNALCHSTMAKWIVLKSPAAMIWCIRPTKMASLNDGIWIHNPAVLHFMATWKAYEHLTFIRMAAISLPAAVMIQRFGYGLFVKVIAVLANIDEILTGRMVDCVGWHRRYAYVVSISISYWLILIE